MIAELELTPVPGAEPTYDDDGRERVEIATCGTCGRSWNDAAVSELTPTPSGRCPFEYEHDDEPDELEPTTRQRLERIAAELERIAEDDALTPSPAIALMQAAHNIEQAARFPLDELERAAVREER